MISNKRKILSLLFLLAVGVIFSLISTNSSIIRWEIRFPTLLLAMFTGAGLSLAGLRLQNIFQNDLTSPFTLGISSACALGAATAEIFELPFYYTVISSCILATFLILLFWRIFHHQAKAKIILAGVAISFLFSSLLMLIQFYSSSWNIFKVTQWLMGSVQSVGVLATLSPGLGFLLLFIDSLISHRNLDIYSLGPELAINKGLKISSFEIRSILVVSIATALIISTTGPIGFVGLMIPHLTRLLFPGLHFHQVLGCSILGAILITCCVILNQNVLLQQLPIGVLTTSIGSIFFFILLWRKN